MFKKSFLFKFLSIAKYSIVNYKKIFPLIKKDQYLYFLIKVIKSQFYITFNPVKLIEKQNMNKKFSFKYSDWFSNHMNIWNFFLVNINKFNYLEIGTFEGRSALFVSELNNCKKIVCVDPYMNYPEADFKMSDVFENVNEKFKKIKNIKLIKKKSDDFFLENLETFNVIYIDGYHEYEYVKRDFINSMSCLEKNGILICDDFLWFAYNKLEKNPIAAILECYNDYKDVLEILFINHQIIFRKI